MRQLFSVPPFVALLAATLVTGVALTASREFGVRRATFPLARPFHTVTNEADDSRASDENTRLPTRLPEAKLATLQQPAAGEGGLDRQLRNHRARLSSDAKLRGLLSVFDPNSGESLTINEIYVYFVQAGRIAAAVKPRDNGEFEVGGLAPGSFSMVAAGRDGFVAFNVEVVAGIEDGASVESAPAVLQVAMQVPQSPLAIDGAAVPPANFSILLRLIRRYLPRDSAANWLNGAAAQAAAEALTPPDSDDPDARPPRVGSTIRKHAVYLRPNGQLRGRVRRLHPRSGQHQRIHRTVIFLMQHDQVFRRTPVDQWGSFAVDGVAPGVYSLAALGTDGFAAFSFRAVRPVQNGDSSIGRHSQMRLAANRRVQADPGPSDLDLALIDPRDFGVLRRILAQHLPGGIGAALAGSALVAPADDGSGSGGGGGGEAIGPDAAAALLGIAAAADDENRQASPFTP